MHIKKHAAHFFKKMFLTSLWLYIVDQHNQKPRPCVYIKDGGGGRSIIQNNPKNCSEFLAIKGCLLASLHQPTTFLMNL